MSTVLDRIVADHQQILIKKKKDFPLAQLEARINYEDQGRSLYKKLSTKGTSGIIAEFKRQSPSKGVIHADADPILIGRGYADAGVAGISVLTDEHFFGGSFADLRAVRSVVTETPILRKDFTIDRYQIFEAKDLQADVILLIAAILSKKQIAEFTQLAHELRLEVLLEIHDESELEKIVSGIDLIGINNRNLKDFTVDPERSIRLLKKLPTDMIKIAESGLDSPITVDRLYREGFRGFLMGENFMKSSDPGKSCKEFIQQLEFIGNPS